MTTSTKLAEAASAAAKAYAAEAACAAEAVATAAAADAAALALIAAARKALHYAVEAYGAAYAKAAATNFASADAEEISR